MPKLAAILLTLGTAALIGASCPVQLAPSTLPPSNSPPTTTGQTPGTPGPTTIPPNVGPDNEVVESCSDCHGINAPFSSDIVHAATFQGNELSTPQTDGDAPHPRPDVNQCSRCHGPDIRHGYADPAMCAVCHTDGMVYTKDARPGAGQKPLDLASLAHKIHNFANLPSTQDSIPINDYRLFDSTAGIFALDPSQMIFTPLATDCRACHADTAWKSYPSRHACATCHEDVDFVNPNPTHPTQSDDSQCLNCHGPGASQSIERVHDPLYVLAVPSGPSDQDADAMVDIDKCNACHGSLTKHGDKTTIQQCRECHKPGLLASSDRTISKDGTANLDFGPMIHTLHNGELDLLNDDGEPQPYVDMHSAKPLSDCSACHVNETYKDLPSSRSCLSCHSSAAAAQHATANADPIDQP